MEYNTQFTCDYDLSIVVTKYSAYKQTFGSLFGAFDQNIEATQK